MEVKIRVKMTPELNSVVKKSREAINKIVLDMLKDHALRFDKPELTKIDINEIHTTNIQRDVLGDFFVVVSMRDESEISYSVGKDLSNVVITATTFKLIRECSAGLAYCVDILMPEMSGKSWVMDPKAGILNIRE